MSKEKMDVLGRLICYICGLGGQRSFEGIAIIKSLNITVIGEGE